MVIPGDVPPQVGASSCCDHRIGRIVGDTLAERDSVRMYLLREPAVFGHEEARECREWQESLRTTMRNILCAHPETSLILHHVLEKRTKQSILGIFSRRQSSALFFHDWIQVKLLNVDPIDPRTSRSSTPGFRQQLALLSCTCTYEKK